MVWCDASKICFAIRISETYLFVFVEFVRRAVVSSFHFLAWLRGAVSIVELSMFKFIADVQPLRVC